MTTLRDLQQPESWHRLPADARWAVLHEARRAPLRDPVVATAALDWAEWALRRARLVFLAGSVLLVVVVVLGVFSTWLLLAGGVLLSAMGAAAVERRKALEVLEALAEAAERQ